MSTTQTEEVSVTPEVVIPEVKASTIAAPDLSPIIAQLSTVRWQPMLAIKVTDEESAKTLAECAAIAQKYEDAVDAALDEPTTAANKLHKFFTGLRGNLKKLSSAVIAHAKTEHRAWEKEKATRKTELERLTNENNKRRAQEWSVSWQEEFAKALAEAMPYEEDDVRARFEACRPAEAVPVRIVAAEPVDKGYKTPGRAPTINIPPEKLPAFILAVAAKMGEFPEVAEWLSPETKPIRAKVFQSPAWMAEHFPMVEIITDPGISYR